MSYLHAAKGGFITQAAHPGAQSFPSEGTRRRMTVRTARGVALRIVVGLIVTASVAGALGSHLGASPASVDLEVAATRSINYRFYDFFNVPFRPFWDLRHTIYERPMNAECYTQVGIDEGLCTPSDPSTPDVASFPYGDWWP